MRSQRPLFQIEEHPRIRIILCSKPMDFLAVLPEGRVAAFEGYVAQVGHGKAPFTIRCAAANDERGFAFHGPEDTGR